MEVNTDHSHTGTRSPDKPQQADSSTVPDQDTGLCQPADLWKEPASISLASLQWPARLLE